MFGSFPKFHKRNISTEIILKLACNFCRRAFGKAVKYAVKMARKAIKEQGGDPDKELPKWMPYQLRHTAATKIRREMGYESVGAWGIPR